MLLELKMRILEVFRVQYRAAQALGIRDDELSAILHRRKKFSQSQIEQLSTLLNLPQSQILKMIEPKKFFGGKNEI